MAAWYLTKGKNQSNTTIRIEDREFITKDKDEVATITIKSKGRPMIHLNRTDKGWYVNDKYLVKKNIMDNMLSTLSRMEINYIPTKAENSTAQERMKKHGIDIKTFDGSGEELTSFILGTNTNDEYGTYCLKEGAQQSYVMSIPVLEGGIREYFNQSVSEFRDLTIVDIPSEKIKKVTVNYPKDMRSSFVIENSSRPTIKPTGSTSFTQDHNQNILDAYLKDFTGVKAELLKNEFFYRDSIRSILPFMEVTIETKDDRSTWLKIYPHLDIHNQYVVTNSVDDLHEKHERFYVDTQRGDFYLSQNTGIGKFMRKVDYFYR